MQYVFAYRKKRSAGVVPISKKLFDNENEFHLESHPNYNFPNVLNISIQLQFNINLADYLTKVRSIFSA